MTDYTASHGDQGEQIVPPVPRTVPLKLRFSRSNSLGSRLTRWLTRSEYSHLEAEHWSGYRIGVTPFDGVTKVYHNPLRQLEDGEDYLYLYLNVSHDQYFRFWMLMEAQIDKPFDWSGLFGFLPRRDWEGTSRWFCPELIATSLLKVGIFLLDERPSRVTPHDIFISPLLYG